MGWIFLAVIFIFLIAQTFSASSSDSPNEVRLAEAEPVLRGALTDIHTLGDKEGGQALKDLETTVQPYRRTDPVAAEIYVSSQTLLGAKVKPQDLAPMAKSKESIDRDAYQIYSRPTLKRADAESLSSGLDKRGFLGELIRAQALAKAGDRRELDRLSSKSSTALIWAFSFVFLVGAGSLGSWIYLAREWSSGRLRPKGLPVRLPTLLDADRLALRAAGLIAMFLLFSLIPDLLGVALHLKVDSRFVELGVGAAILVGVPLLFRKPVGGRVFRLSDIGVSRQNLARDLRFGLIGFGIEIPVAVTLAVIGQALFSSFHHSSHPATVALEMSHDWLTLLSTFVLASIVAPFWEEIMFRGLLFPALSKVTGRVLYGGIVSSFLFGAVHPQGFPLWMALMGLACVSCALSHYTNSMVPSMVMHAAHNTALLVLTILYS
jgi:membrane protease YdiL (CAAX protease family)